MDNSPRFSDVSSFAYSDELNFPPSSSTRNVKPSVPNTEAPQKTATKRPQPVLGRAAAVVQATEQNRVIGGVSWQRSLRSSKNVNDTPTRNGTLSRTLTSRALDLNSSLASSLSVADSTVSRRTKASTASSKTIVERNSATKTSRLNELAHLQEQLEIKGRLLSAMEQQVLDAVQQIEDLQKETESVKYEKDMLQDECVQLRTENAGLTGQMKHLKEARTKLHRRCQEAEEGMDQMRKQLDDMKANSDVACVSADICKAALAQSLSEALAIHFRMLEAQSLLQNCQSELEMHRRHVRQLSDMLEQMHCQLSGALDQLEQATNSERQLKAQLATLQKEVNTALDRLSESQHHHSALEAQELELLARLEHLMLERVPNITNTSIPSLSSSSQAAAGQRDKAYPIDESGLVMPETGEHSEDVHPIRDQDESMSAEEAVDDIYDTLSQNGITQMRLEQWLKAAIQQGEAAVQRLDSSYSSVYSETPNKRCPPEFLLNWTDGKQMDASLGHSISSLHSSPQAAGTPPARFPTHHQGVTKNNNPNRSAILSALLNDGGILTDPEAVQKLLQADGGSQPNDLKAKSHVLISTELLQSLMPYIASPDGHVGPGAGWNGTGLDDATDPFYGMSDVRVLSEEVASLMQQQGSLGDAARDHMGTRACDDDHMVQYTTRDKELLEVLLHDMLELQGCCRYLLNLPSLRDTPARMQACGEACRKSPLLNDSLVHAGLPESNLFVLGENCKDVNPTCSSFVPYASGDEIIPASSSSVPNVNHTEILPAISSSVPDVQGVDAVVAIECVETAVSKPQGIVVDEPSAVQAVQASHKLCEAKEKLQQLLDQVSDAVATVAELVVLATRAASQQLQTAVHPPLPVLVEEDAADTYDAEGEISSPSSTSMHGKRRWVVAEPETFNPEGMEDLGFLEHVTGCVAAASDSLECVNTQELQACLQPAGSVEDEGCVVVAEDCHPEVQNWRELLHELQLQYEEVVGLFDEHGSEDGEAAKQLQRVMHMLRMRDGTAVGWAGFELKSVRALLDAHVVLGEKEQKLQKAAARFEEVKQQVQATEQKLQATGQQAEAAEQQLQVAEQQLQAAEQQLKAAEQQVEAAEQQMKVAEQQLCDRERVHHAEVATILDEAAKRLAEIERRFVEAEQQLSSKDTLYHSDVCALRLQVEDRDSQLRAWEQRLVEVTEKLQQQEKQQAETAQQLLEREAQLLHTLSKFERMELQLHLGSHCLPGQLPIGCRPAYDQFVHRPQRLLFGSPLLERQPSRPFLHQYTTSSLSQLTSQYKLNSAMNRTSIISSLPPCTNPACSCPYCVNSPALACIPATTQPMHPSRSASNLHLLPCADLASGIAPASKLRRSDGVVSHSRSRARLGRRLFMIGVPGAVLVVACMWVAELLRKGGPVKGPMVPKKAAAEAVKPPARFPWQRDS